MSSQDDVAALIALLRNGRQAWSAYTPRVERGEVMAALEEETGLLAGEELTRASADLESWGEQGIGVVSVVDPAYPVNLRAVPDRPPLLFLAGQLDQCDARAVAVIGSRRASPTGIDQARAISSQLIGSGYTVASGLAAGIDTAAHQAALELGGRTIAVIGTGLLRSYPAENAALQQQIAERCAVISRFWPEAPPTRKSFPLRNAVTSGISLATVIVEAAETSGARIQARLSLAQGRPVLLVDSLLRQDWARELSDRPGTHVIGSPAEVPALIDRLSAQDPLVA